MPRKLEPPFDAHAFLDSAGVGKRIATFARRDTIFSQGDPCDTVMYIQTGAARLSVLSHAGKEAVVATLGPGDFLGEGALAGHPVRLETARATMATTVLVIPRREMVHLLHSEHASQTGSSSTCWGATPVSRPTRRSVVQFEREAARAHAAVARAVWQGE
jgi:CRP/FNR family transcriptional regulator, cyclic AMP receptor protein